VVRAAFNWLGLLSWLGLLVATTSCAARTAVDAKPRQSRTICGTEQLTSPPTQPHLHLGVAANPAQPIGQYQVTVSADPDLPVATAMQTLEPLFGSLLRLKLVARQSWLLSLTIPQPRLHHHVALSSGRTPSESTVVGDRRIVRVAGSPVARFAQLRLRGKQLQLVVEGEEQAQGAAPHLVPLAKLVEVLRGHTPPIEVFSLSATDDTRWQQLLDTVIAAACYDREPGQEPHEVLWERSP